MNILHNIPHIDSEASGPSYSVRRLCQQIALYDHDVTLACLKAKHEIPGVKLFIHPSWPIFKKFAISHKQAFLLSKQAFKEDIVHNHSLWSMVNIAAGLVASGKHAKLVTSPRGTLSPWALKQKKFFKQILWPLQKQVLERANLLHATSESEYKDIRRLGLKKPVLIVPNGIDLPKLSPRSIKDKKILLFFSRIHPTKGLEVLLDVWANLEKDYIDWELKIAGPGDDDYIKKLKDQVSKNKLRNVKFTGPLYGNNKSFIYRNADLFVLPTHSENFGMVVAEALGHECPTIVFQGAPWSKLKKEKCGWWIPNNAQSLKSTLQTAMSLPQKELQAMGARGRRWMKRDFSWDRIGKMMNEGYNWIVRGGKPPSTVKFD